MSAPAMPAAPVASAEDIAERIRALDWARLSLDLDAAGNAMLERLLWPDECRELAGLYPADHLFRSRIVMKRHGFGRGEYQYFGYPLPEVIAGLRIALYRHLAPIADRWNEALGIGVRYPAEHPDFIARCHEAGQRKPTPLLPLPGG